MGTADPLIAVVDDEAPVRTMLERQLRLAHYRVIAFASGDEFLTALADLRPSCAIVDIHMPGLSGLHVQSRLRSAKHPTPVVMITASDDVSLERLALDAGASCLLRKPFSGEALLSAVASALRRAGDGT